MAARCWACEIGLTPIGYLPEELSGDPVGACWECHVFGCLAHAERDAGSGKFLCFPSVATALSASSGLEEFEPEIRFAPGEWEERLPRLASETEEARGYWRAGRGEGRLATTLSDSEWPLNFVGLQFSLVADALAIAALLRPEPDAAAHRERAAGPAHRLFPGRLGELVDRV